MDLRIVCKDTNVKDVDVIKQRVSRMGYSVEVKRNALKYYLEGIGFRRIERLLGISHVTVINWVKKAGEKINDIVFEEKKSEKVNVLEVDELCINLKKN